MGDAQGPRGLGENRAGEVPQLHELGDQRLRRSEAVQRLVESFEVGPALRVGGKGRVELDAPSRRLA